MGIAKLGPISFRLDPDQISYAYKVDSVTIDTLGGQVVQVLGATLGDMTLVGSFGQDHQNKLESWQLAESFHRSIRALIDSQAVPQKSVDAPIHTPIPFSFNDGVHNWNFKVLIKGISDPDTQMSGGAVEFRSGKFSYRYVLTLFIVEDESLVLNKIATDTFITRIANGVGWKAAGTYQGGNDLASAISYIQQHSSDGTIYGYISNLISGTTTTNAPPLSTPASPNKPPVGPGTTN